MMLVKVKQLIVMATISFLLASCASSSEVNPPTANGLAVVGGGAIGAGTAALLGGSRSVITLAGIGGGSLGYYLSTLRFQARGIIHAGGQVYTLGDYVIIEVPTDNLFDANTADFLEGTGPVLDSIAGVLKRYPGHNVIISGNTSGSWTRRFEQKMSECRAEQVASAIWTRGVSASRRINEQPKNGTRQIYVGYGDRFPIANQIRIRGIRANSRIQIVAYPSNEVLHWDKCKKRFKRYHFKPITQQGMDDTREVDLDNYKSVFTEDPYSEQKEKIASGELADARVEGAIPSTQNPGDLLLNEEFTS